MSFEMKYKPDGTPISQPEPVFEQKIQPEPEQQLAEEPSVEVEQESQPEQQVVQESSTERNFKELRQKASQFDRVARERDEMMRRVQELESRSAPQQPQVPQAQEEDDVLGNDDLVEGKHLSKMGRKIKGLEEKLRQYEQKSSMSNTEMRLRSEYPDFDKVVCAENLNSLREQEPYLAESIGNDPDIYRKAVSAYKLIKKMGVYVEDTYQHEKALVQKNAAKPKSLASISPQQGESPLSRANVFANGLTDDLKKQLFEEMRKASR